MAQPKRAEETHRVEETHVQQRASVRAEEVKVEEQVVSEERQAIVLFQAMLNKMGEMYTAALGLDNTPELADVLAQLGIARVKIEGVIEKLKLEEAMRVDAEKLAEGVTDGSD